ncbi:MAG: DUF5104 domain-containing protein [Coriobacteriales bacterium]|jgi:hypothetical protein|nr:DUF5104 domain-containing protein [Coriobacteriales bacterium]
MRHLVLLTIAALIAFSLAGCDILSETVFLNEVGKSEEMAQRIIAALDARDEEALLGVFSERALQDARDMDRGLEYLFKKYQGTSMAVEGLGRGGSTADHYGPPGRSKVVHAHCTITTTEREYTLRFDYYLINEEDPSMIGVYKIALFYPEDGMAERHSISADLAGIYYPGWDDSTTQLQAHITAPLIAGHRADNDVYTRAGAVRDASPLRPLAPTGRD